MLHFILDVDGIAKSTRFALVVLALFVAISISILIDEVIVDTPAFVESFRALASCSLSVLRV